MQRMQSRRFHEDFPATSFLLLFIIALFALEVVETYRIHEQLPALFGFGGIDGNVLRRLGWFELEFVENGEVWRLLTAVFLHGGFLHILFNGFVLYDLGAMSEARLGTWKFFVVFALSGIGGTVGTLLWNLYNRDWGGSGRIYPSVGASGALAGLIGLWLVYSLTQRDEEMRNGLLRWIMYIVLLSVFMGGIDHAGHIGGFIAGGLLGLTVRSAYATSREAQRWRYPGYACAAIVAVAIGCGLWNFFQER